MDITSATGLRQDFAWFFVFVDAQTLRFLHSWNNQMQFARYTVVLFIISGIFPLCGCSLHKYTHTHYDEVSHFYHTRSNACDN